MTEIQFWRATPVKIRLLTSKHFEILNPEAKPKVANTVEELPFEI